MTTKQQLFRQEAINACRGQWMGTVHVATPLSRWIWTALGASLAAAIVVFLVFGHYTRRDRANGRLVPSTGLLSVTATHEGTVTRVDVHSGEHVRKGQALVEISGDEHSATLGDTRADISKQLRSQRQRLRDDLQLQKQRGQSQSTALKTQLQSLQAQQQQWVAQIRLQKKQAGDAQSLLKRIQPLLQKGYVSALQIQQQKAAALQGQAQLKVLRRQHLGTRQQIASTQQNLNQLPIDLATQTHATLDSISEVEQQLAQNEAARAVVLRAPHAGTVSTILAQQGQHVAAGQPVASIVPQGATLQAQLLIPSRAVGFIKPGSSVVLRYQAYPYQKFGQQYGHVEHISSSALNPQEVATLTGQQAKQPVYRVRVRLEHQSIPTYGQSRALKPGMAFSADIMMDRRSLLEWIFEPLYGMKHWMQSNTGEQSHG